MMHIAVHFRAEETVAHICAEAQKFNLPIYTNAAGEFALFSHTPEEGGWQLFGVGGKFGVACRDGKSLDDYSHEAEITGC